MRRHADRAVIGLVFVDDGGLEAQGRLLRYYDKIVVGMTDHGYVPWHRPARAGTSGGEGLKTHHQTGINKQIWAPVLS
ncbi:hypothetical protein [Variovorax sp. YR634]|uniref:hypothetical protein n=1 Tax=Variovorax sp. YR634 TaxID=1884385 RepID=UPI00115F9E9D|nr:hypothetical protein [Variovorax sp. YR634]